ncbi:MAG: DNA replication protein [Alphaproteobacteria bacterium]|nr:DNA replication protein [Alphaproteobacteria bacterium]
MTYEPNIEASESPLSRLYLRKDNAGKSYIDGRQFIAGERLRKDFELAHMAPRVTASYAESSGSGGRHWQMSDNAISRMSDNTIAARERLHCAFSAVGAELSGILYQVCCVSAGFEKAELILALPPRSGKAVLALALTRLARHYGLIITRKPSPKDAISSWAVDDYRPTLMPRHVP